MKLGRSEGKANGLVGYPYMWTQNRHSKHLFISDGVNIWRRQCLWSILNNFLTPVAPFGWPFDLQMPKPRLPLGNFLSWQKTFPHSSWKLQQLWNLLIVSLAKLCQNATSICCWSASTGLKLWLLQLLQTISYCFGGEQHRAEDRNSIYYLAKMRYDDIKSKLKWNEDYHKTIVRLWWFQLS